MRWLKPGCLPVAVAVVAVLVFPKAAAAELIFFSADRSISVKSYRIEGERIIVQMRGGGEMEFSRSLVTDIRPDEVPDQNAASTGTPAIQNQATAQLFEKTGFDAIIERASSRHGLPARLVKAIIQVESSYDPRARSPKGARGLMQLMPATAREYRARNAFDPAANIEAGTRYLKKLLGRFDLPLALAAYNAGEAAVLKYGGIPPFPETQDYVAKVLSLAGDKILLN
jgi:soluble lytic murein transglycosylase-like protein